MKTLEYIELDNQHIVTPNGDVYKKKNPNINKNGYMTIWFNGKSVSRWCRNKILYKGHRIERVIK